MGKTIFRLESPDKETLDSLYVLFEQAIEIASTTSWAWAERARPALNKCLSVLRAFLKGEAVTDDVKAQFKTLSKLGEEVLMNDTQTRAVLCVTEAAHAAAHLGHLVTAGCKMGDANQDYATLQKAYVMFGIMGVKRFAVMIAEERKKRKAA